MITRKLAAAAAASLAATLLLTGASSAVASASALAAVPNVNGYWTDIGGTGPTLPAAEQDAKYNAADFGCVGSNTLVSSSESNGVWTAVIKAFCPNGS